MPRRFTYRRLSYIIYYENHHLAAETKLRKKCATISRPGPPPPLRLQLNAGFHFQLCTSNESVHNPAGKTTSNTNNASSQQGVAELRQHPSGSDAEGTKIPNKLGLRRHALPDLAYCATCQGDGTGRLNNWDGTRKGSRSPFPAHASAPKVHPA